MTELQQAEAWVRQGRGADALAAAVALLAQDPRNPRLLGLLVNAANLSGDLDRAIDGLQRLQALQPTQAQWSRLLATALNNRGNARRARGEARTALQDFRQALLLQPAHPQAWFNYGLALRDAARPADARAALHRHLALAPGDREAQFLLASLQQREAAALYLDALPRAELATLDAGLVAQLAAHADRPELAADALTRLQPGEDLRAATAAAIELWQAGEATLLQRAAPALLGTCRVAGRSSLRLELLDALALPAVYASLDELAHWRRRYLDGLDRLEAEWSDARLALEPVALRQLAHANFLLAYQGLDDRLAQVRYAALLQRAAGAMLPELAAPPSPRRSGRIGLLSSGWRECTVGAYFGAWIDWLREAGFAVHLYQLGPRHDDTTTALGARASTFRFLDGRLEQVAQQVRDDDLDLLLYPELGMDARLAPLAALRLARRQAAAWGHPVTSGYATIDDYLSCAAMEPADGASHYRERLVALPGLGVDYRRPPMTAVTDADALGLDPARPRVLVPQSVFKLHPDGDAVMAAIAARLPSVQFLAFAAERPRWWSRYHARLARAFATVGRRLDDHLVVLPLGSRERYLQVNRACDVMLDSLHWSGGNTALDAFGSGLPVVACPGRFMRGRQSLAMLQRLGLAAELVCADPAAQAARVVALLARREERVALSRRIHECLPDLFESDHARAAFQQWAREQVEECG